MLRKGTLLSDEAVRKHCIQNLGSREGVRLDKDGVIRFTRTTTDQQIVNLDAHKKNDYESVRRMIVDKDEESRLLKYVEEQQVKNTGEVVLTKRSNAYRIYSKQMHDYNNMIAQGIIGLKIPSPPDTQILSHNRMRVGTHQQITTKSLQDQQRDFRKYIDANSRLTVLEKDAMFRNFNLHQSTKPTP
eukprot:6211728-Pleurochrysis_carterae.AAC.2